MKPGGILRVPDHLSQEVKTEFRRTTGITPRMLGAFPESPARLLPKTKGLKALGSSGRSKAKVSGL